MKVIYDIMWYFGAYIIVDIWPSNALIEQHSKSLPFEKTTQHSHCLLLVKCTFQHWLWVTIFVSGLWTSGFIFVCTFFVQKEKCSPFLELTPTLWQMPQDVTNISEDWADFCQCQEFWCHFLSFIFLEWWPFWLWEDASGLKSSNYSPIFPHCSQT